MPKQNKVNAPAPRVAPAQGNFVNSPNAPAGANVPVGKPVKVPVAPALPKGKLFVVKDNVSGFIHSNPLNKVGADAALVKIEAKERKEHPEGTLFEFVIVEFN